MTTKAAFTPEEWNQLIQAPLNVAMLITVASPSLFGSIKEMWSAAQALIEAAQQHAPNELMGDIFAVYTDQNAFKAAEPKYDTKDPHALRQQILANVGAAAALVGSKGTAEEAGAFNQWLYDFGVRQANSAKEGGFLGIGAVRVSEAEKNALAELADVLGLKPGTAADAPANTGA